MQRLGDHSLHNQIKKATTNSTKSSLLPFKPKSLDDLSSWQDKSSSQKGWVSIDRSMVAALPSTTPRPAHKSSTDDLGPPLCQVNEEESYSVLSTKKQSSPDQDGVWRLSFPKQGQRRNGIIAMTRWDSALEAFRHNPMDGSFAPLTDRSTKMQDSCTGTIPDFSRYSLCSLLECWNSDSISFFSTGEMGSLWKKDNFLYHITSTFSCIKTNTKKESRALQSGKVNNIQGIY